MMVELQGMILPILVRPGLSSARQTNWQVEHISFKLIDIYLLFIGKSSPRLSEEVWPGIRTSSEQWIFNRL